MADAAHVLIYGKDERLLDTRSMILEKCGYRVRVALKLSDIASVGIAEDLRLLIFCHTVSLEECGRAIALCQVRWPAARTLFLSVGGMACETSLSSEVLDALDGPAKLISTVGRIIASEHVSQAHIC
jgi:hypothetical protein